MNQQSSVIAGRKRAMKMRIVAAAAAAAARNSRVGADGRFMGMALLL